MDQTIAPAGKPPTYLRQYWTFQIAGWSAMALLSFLSLTIWYNPGEFAPALHTLLQSLLGILVSHPLRAIARRLWTAPIRTRIVLNALAAVAASLLWTALRIQTFTLLTGEVIPVSDFGGWIFASVIVFGAWSLCYHAFRYYRQSLEEHQLVIEAQNATLKAQAKAQTESFKRLEAEKLFRDSQMRMLKYQLSPHFFLNALNSVSSLVRKGDRENAMIMLAKIGDFLRISLSDPLEVHHPLAEEVAALETYLAIEKIRFGERLITEFSISEEARDVEVPSLLLQPLFENSIKYAVGRTLEPTTIRLEAHVQANELEMTVSDNGPGAAAREEMPESATPGIGLTNVRQRLESAYGADFTFDIAPQPGGGLAATIRIPVRTARAQ